jgi:hypothetical protein
MGEGSDEKKKGGFFRKLFKITAVLAAIGAALMFWKRRQGEEKPPGPLALLPSGGDPGLGACPRGGA